MTHPKRIGQPILNENDRIYMEKTRVVLWWCKESNSQRYSPSLTLRNSIFKDYAHAEICKWEKVLNLNPVFF